MPRPANLSLPQLMQIITKTAQQTAGTGDISGVTAGNGLSGGGVRGDVTLAVDINGATSGTDITVNNSDLILLADVNDSNNVKKVRIDQLTGSAAHGPAGSNTQLQYNNNGQFGAITTFTYDGTDLTVADDIKINFGARGATAEAYIKYDEAQTDHLIISGSNTAMQLQSPKILMPGKLGVGSISIGNVSHGITLPDTADETGRIKANAFVTYSSIALKDNVSRIERPIDTLNKIEGVTFNWKSNDRKDIGFIAEDVGKHMPEIVEWKSNNIDAHGMDYTKLVPVLVEAVKSQQEEILSLHEAIAALQKKIDS
tara:strand:+ start:857 stop:1795 length:939 start_codon:yes stop_codon:yes gene_type:complete